MKKTCLLIFVLLRFHNLHSQQIFIPVFLSGKDGYSSFRIPAIIRAPNGDLLAFCEGRVNSAGDFGNIDIVMKTSSDNGASWGPLTVIIDARELQAGNPAPVVDLTDPEFPAGRIFLFCNEITLPSGLAKMKAGPGKNQFRFMLVQEMMQLIMRPIPISSKQVKKQSEYYSKRMIIPPLFLLLFNGNELAANKIS